jgi:alpha-beta hydrolase superfamily lysophospholipase
MLKRLARFLVTSLLGGMLTLLAVGIWFMNNLPALNLWHEVDLEGEFTADSGATTLEQYLRIESALFRQLDERVVSRLDGGDPRQFNRYNRASPSYPGRWSRDWNRSFELGLSSPRAGVLLLHGMSDAPYSLRSQAEALHAAGAWVLGLRLPGHGTVPSGLVHARWQDMAAAVRIGMDHLRAQLGDKPIIVVGYSNGGALATYHALLALENPALVMPDKLVLISPAIGVTPLAALAVWQERIGRLLDLNKLQWTSVLPEFNPYKYNSFAVGAGHQTRELTVQIRALLDRVRTAGSLERFPSVLAFQSAVDATVSTPALITGLMDRLPDNGHELVLFGVNRREELSDLLNFHPEAYLRPLLEGHDLPFTLTLLLNAGPDTRELIEERWLPGAAEPIVSAPGLLWPQGVFSLSHVALPFPPDDPLYGRVIDAGATHVQLGELALRGERGVLSISGDDMLRQTWNPFHAWMQRRLLEFVELNEQRVAGKKVAAGRLGT